MAAGAETAFQTLSYDRPLFGLSWDFGVGLLSPALNFRIAVTRD
jgi:hypothetical protein